MLIALPNLDGSFTCTLFMPFDLFKECETEEDGMGVRVLNLFTSNSIVISVNYIFDIKKLNQYVITK